MMSTVLGFAAGDSADRPVNTAPHSRARLTILRDLIMGALWPATLRFRRTGAEQGRAYPLPDAPSTCDSLFAALPLPGHAEHDPDPSGAGVIGRSGLRHLHVELVDEQERHTDLKV